MMKQYGTTEINTLTDLRGKSDRTNKVSEFNSPVTHCWFALPVDNSIGGLFSNKYVRKAFNSFVKSKYYEKIEQLFDQSHKVTPATFPGLFKILKHCSEKLALNPIPPLVVSDKIKGINALTIGTDRFAYIIISPMTITLLNKKELEFLIGHECGHVLQNDLTIHTVYGLINNYISKNQVIGGIVSDMISTPINYWHRCSEITSDRAGIICCNDLEVAERMVLYSELGYSSIRNGNCNDIIAQCKKEYIDPVKNLFELDSLHPMASKRLIALGLFDKVVNSNDTRIINNEIIKCIK